MNLRGGSTPVNMGKKASCLRPEYKQGERTFTTTCLSFPMPFLSPVPLLLSLSSITYLPFEALAGAPLQEACASGPNPVMQQLLLAAALALALR